MTNVEGLFGLIFFCAATYLSFFLLGAALIFSLPLYFRGTPTMRRIFGTGVKFVVSMFVMTMFCSIVWEKFVDGKIYDCTDPLFGYLSPDGWIGGGNFPVVVVKHVVSGRSMSEPDEIKEGWSVADLWLLWFLLFGTSLVISIWFAWRPDRGTPLLRQFL